MKESRSKKEILSLSDIHQNVNDSYRVPALSDRPLGLRLSDLKTIRKQRILQGDAVKPQSNYTEESMSRNQTKERIKSGKQTYNVRPGSSKKMLTEEKMKDRYRLVDGKVSRSEDKLRRKQIPSFSNLEALPSLHGKFSIHYSRADKVSDVEDQRSRQPRFMINDSSLPQLLTKTSGSKNSPERGREIKLNGQHSKQVGDFLNRQRREHQVPRDLNLRMGYYLHKVHLHSKYGNTVVKKEHFEHFQKNYQDLKKLSSDSLIVDHHMKAVSLPASHHRQLLVLDLDETLVHCCNFDGKTNANTVCIPLQTKFVKGLLRFNVRPGVDQFLKKMVDHYQIVVFTASDREYAKAILDYIDPQQRICQLLARENCSFTRSGHLVKDLRVFQNRDLSRMVLVDNSTKCSIPQIDNAVPILSFINDPEDRELDELSHFLVELTRKQDIQSYLKAYFQTHRYAVSPSHHHLLDSIVKNFD